jgi:C_GCAxxG_C_C family probable redox protein
MSTDHYPKEKARYNTRSDKAGSMSKVLDRIAKAAYNNNRAYEGCARCVLSALQTHLHLMDDDKAFRGVMKSSTALSAGVARKGETCGALLGALMAVGLERGTERLNDFDGYVDTMVAASEVFDRFRNKYGTVKCFEIQEQLLGRSVDFFNDEDAEWWYEHGGLDKCPGVCSVVARIAAEEIIELSNREISYTK